MLTGERTDLKCVEADCGCALRLRPGRHGHFYACSRWPECPGTLPAEKDGSPRGEPRLKSLQRKRNAGHNVFDPIWKSAPDFYTGEPIQNPNRLRGMARRRCYAYLAYVMGISVQNAHFYLFTEEQCDRAIELLHDVTYTQVRKWWHSIGKHNLDFKPKQEKPTHV